VGGVLDDLVAQVVGGFHGAIEARIESLANEVKKAIGTPMARSNGASRSGSSFGAGTTPEVSAGIPRAD
jgi:hypothetical protein